ncbi:methyltransferase domain-containing protein [Draconibacterium sp. IB214405]|uniref:class I SAM-dependent methyltransferase n=1 Tax=Draconibacterium sp. IB214405 TaxID=3097352 RepID=UPI002A12FF59|nr:methyltransferase domain-containing protein [Draconibacterium sp. IB214405]MDX8341108.1 methyltransferase domain-containing protein [Draconibacterium sp. IB214405]
METTHTVHLNRITGYGHENIPNIGFKLMEFAMKISDLFVGQSERNFSRLPLKEGQIVVDYGCGPARYVKNASETVGPNGKVFAIDIHPMAISNVNRKIEKHGLTNVEALQADGYSCALPNRIADVVYALDMFHMIEQPTELIRELARIVMFHGIIVIEDGHQSRAETLEKIKASGLLCVCSENKHHVVCKLKETKCLPPA